MIHPAWLADTFVVLMVIATLYVCAGFLSSRWHGSPPEHGLDLVALRLAMCVAMAGMLIPRVDINHDTAWTVFFALAAAWFASRMVRDLLADRRSAPSLINRRSVTGSLGHHGHHLLACGAMLYMYLGTSMSMGSMSMGSMSMASMASMSKASMSKAMASMSKSEMASMSKEMGSMSGSTMKSMSMSTGRMSMTIRYPIVPIAFGLLFLGLAVWTARRLSMSARSGHGDGTTVAAPKVGIGVQIGTFLMMGYMMIVMS